MSKVKQPSTNITGFDFKTPDIKTLIINTEAKDFRLFEQFMDLSIDDNGRDIIIKELYKTFFDILFIKLKLLINIFIILS